MLQILTIKKDEEMTNADFSSSVSVPIKLMSEGGREQIKGAYKNLGNIMTNLKNIGKKKEEITVEVIKNPARTFPGNTPGTSVFIRDNLKVITNKAGDIITVILQ